MTSRRWLLTGCLALAAALIAGCSLASEPVPAGPIETGPLPGEVVESNVPVTLPRAAAGAVTYAARCASCHGADGAGDGEFAAQLAEQGASLPDFTDPGLARSRSPQEWYQIITLGSIMQGGLMPPWRDSLTDTERWDVTYYLYSLSTPPEALAAGEPIFQARCAECHGEGGEQATVLADFARMSALSTAAVVSHLTSGEQDFHDLRDLPEADILAVAEYARSLSYDPALPAPGAEAPPAEEAAPPTGESAPAEEAAAPEEAAPGAVTVQGIVTTADGAAVSQEAEVRLIGITVDQNGNFNPFLETTATAGADGRFRFPDLPADQPNTAYIVTVIYEGVEFANGAMLAPGESVIDLPVTVYGNTTDASVVTVEAAHIVVRFHPDALLVMQVLVFSNRSDKVYLSEALVRGGQPGSVAISLPPDAENVTFEEGQLGGRFVEAGDRIYDTQQVLPGQSSHSIIVSYVLPYSGSREISLPFDYGARTVTVLVEDGGRVRSDRLTGAGSEVMQGTAYDQYLAQDIAPGETLSFRLSGGALAAGAGGIVGPAAVAVGVLAIVGGVYLWATRRRESAHRAAALEALAPDQEALLRQIADLDDQLAAGRINRLDYEARRADLKARLAEMLE